jgi:hypothetical protein
MNEYVSGFLFSFDLQEVLLIQKAHFPQKDKWVAPGGLVTAGAGVYISMELRFTDDTGVVIPAKHWHCFATKQYGESSKFYYFATFGDWIKKFPLLWPEKDSYLCRHNYIDLAFESGADYKYDTKNLIDIVLSEMRNNSFMRLNPEGVNSWKIQKPTAKSGS